MRAQKVTFAGCLIKTQLQSAAADHKNNQLFLNWIGQFHYNYRIIDIELKQNIYMPKKHKENDSFSLN